VVEAADGESGLARARAMRPDAITLDVLMPGMDGWAVLAALKAEPRLADTPVVMLTILDEKNTGFALGASEYLTKPIDRDRLVAALTRSALGGSDRPVLVVDDDAATRASVRRTLELAGWRVREAINGRDALSVLRDAEPQVVLLDLMMPEMDGFEFLETLREKPEWRAIPVVVMTAKDLTEADRRQLNGGVARIVQKGSRDRASLLTTVHDLVTARVPG
jgi:CheY-like chemotaxis protein